MGILVRILRAVDSSYRARVQLEAEVLLYPEILRIQELKVNNRGTTLSYFLPVPQNSCFKVKSNR